MNLVVDYVNGCKMSYSLNSFSPWEGYQVSFNGTRGRLEHLCQETAYVSGDGTIPGALKREGTWIRVFPHWEPAYEVELWTAEGGHGGADPRLMDYVFDPKSQPKDQYKRAADQRSGAYCTRTSDQPHCRIINHAWAAWVVPLEYNTTRRPAREPALPDSSASGMLIASRM